MEKKIRIFIIILFFVGCSKRKHIADLETFSNHQNQKIILLTSEKIIKSTSSFYNKLPQHDLINKEKVFWFLEDRCKGVQGIQICFDSYFLGVVLNLRFKSKNSDESQLLFNYPNPFTSVRIYKLIDYGEDLIGVLHSNGFTVIKDKGFCSTVSTNPNGRFHTGMTIDSSNNVKDILITSFGPIEKVDKEFEGWKKYSLDKLCPKD